MNPIPEDLERMTYRAILEALYTRVDTFAQEQEQNRRP